MLTMAVFPSLHAQCGPPCFKQSRRRTASHSFTTMAPDLVPPCQPMAVPRCPSTLVTSRPETTGPCTYFLSEVTTGGTMGHRIFVGALLMLTTLGSHGEDSNTVVRVIYTGTYGDGRLFVALDAQINEPGCIHTRFDVP